MFIVEVYVVEIYGEIVSWIGSSEMVKQCLIKKFPPVKIIKESCETKEDGTGYQPKQDSSPTEKARKQTP